MIQILINIGPDRAEIFRCDDLIDMVKIPLDKSTGDKQVGLICSTPSLLTVVKEVARACEEASEHADTLRRMTALEARIDNFISGGKK